MLPASAHSVAPLPVPVSGVYDLTIATIAASMVMKRTIPNQVTLRAPKTTVGKRETSRIGFSRANSIFLSLSGAKLAAC